MGAAAGRPVEDASGYEAFDTVRASLRGLSTTEAITRLDSLEVGLRQLRFEVLEGHLQTSIAQAQPSPAIAAGLAASQRELDALESSDDTRLLSAGEMAEYVSRGRNWAAQSAKAGTLIRVEHAGRVVYPAFQIDPDTRTVREWVPQVVAILGDFGLDGRDFTVWAATPSPRFDGDRPAVHSGDPDFLSRAAAALADL